jgi:hypothetical protein
VCWEPLGLLAGQMDGQRVREDGHAAFVGMPLRRLV